MFCMHFLRKWFLTVLVNSKGELQAANGKHVEKVYSQVRKEGLFFSCSTQTLEDDIA